jgi:GMP reductase
MPQNFNRTEYNYRDILLQPKYSPLESRSEASTSIAFGGRTFSLPIIPANMKTVIDEDLAVWLASRGYFYVMHRFDVDVVQFCLMMKEKSLFTSISVGVNTDSYENLHSLCKSDISPDYITVDIAHGACDKMKKMVEYIREHFNKTTLIIGNVCTRESTRFLCELGPDAIKVGIGPGSVCTTKLKTGFSRPQFSAVIACSEVCDEYEIMCIADGGIEHNGDIAKALVAGADMVMIGGMLAGFDESPGRSITQLENGREVHYKEFFGSASENCKKEKRNVEGRRKLIPLKGPISDKYIEITQDLQSSISYAGGRDLKAFINVDWVVVH